MIFWDHEEDNAVIFPVDVFQRFKCQELRIVFLEECAIACGGLEKRVAADSQCGQDQRDYDDRLTSCDDPLSKSYFKTLRSGAGFACHVWQTLPQNIHSVPALAVALTN